LCEKASQSEPSTPYGRRAPNDSSGTRISIGAFRFKVRGYKDLAPADHKEILRVGKAGLVGEASGAEDIFKARFRFG
jgi:hypothetical protein